MPQCRRHKRLCKSVKILKKLNHNKEKTAVKSGHHFGTGLRYDAWEESKERSKDPNYLETACKTDKHYYMNSSWGTRNPGRILESPIHDRTKWKSAKQATKMRNRSRDNPNKFF